MTLGDLHPDQITQIQVSYNFCWSESTFISQAILKSFLVILRSHDHINCFQNKTSSVP